MTAFAAKLVFAAVAATVFALCGHVCVARSNKQGDGGMGLALFGVFLIFIGVALGGIVLGAGVWKWH